MGRRGNGEGSITRRKDGRWEAKYTVHTVKGPKRLCGAVAQRQR